MPFEWRVDPLQLLKESGYTTYRIRKEKIFSESVVQKLRNREPISINEMDTYCTLTGKSIGKLIQHVPPKKPEKSDTD